MSVLVDTNVLLRRTQPNHEHHAIAMESVARLLAAGETVCFTSQNVAEFWNTCTRPLDQNGFGLSPQETDRRARAFEDKLRFLPDSAAVHEEWRALLVSHKVSGVQVHDARLAAAMRVHGIQRILTFNERDFARYPEIQAVHPRALLTKNR